MADKNWQLQKRATGIPGLDALTHGGLPDSQATLIIGRPGTGKTVLALQILANAIARGEGGVFVSFEESPRQVLRNADSFLWGDTLCQSDNWCSIDARMQPGVQSAGAFDIDGMIAMLEVKAAQFDKPWVAIDGIDQLLRYQPNVNLAVDQVRRLNEQCSQNGWTLLLSGKEGGDPMSPQYLEGVEFMLPTTLVLSAVMTDQMLHRHIRIAKYRGSSHNPNEVSMVMNDHGIQLPYQAYSAGEPDTDATTERVSTGIERLDELLAGGPYRGSSTLISGRPGTAKSTISASFAEAAAKRGERVLYISFDEVQAPFVRNLAGVGINLQPHIDEGRIRFVSRGTWSSLVSEHVLEIQRQVEDFDPQLIVIDPFSGMLKANSSVEPRVTSELVVAMLRARGITTVLTSLTDENDLEAESTVANASTTADTWIVLDYNERAGERNRSLSIVKSRGSGHSNQQRELLLSSEGIDLADVYEFGTDVLMGTARRQKEGEQKARKIQEKVEFEQRRAELRRKLALAQSETESLKAKLELEQQVYDASEQADQAFTDEMTERRATGSSSKKKGEPG
jgi:circadian clock protein KaiC